VNHDVIPLKYFCEPPDASTSSAASQRIAPQFATVEFARAFRARLLLHLSRLMSLLVPTGSKMRALSLPSLLSACSLVLTLYSFPAHADDSARDQLIQQLVQAQQSGVAETADTQLTKMLLAQARQLNTSASQDLWQTVQDQVNAAISSAQAQHDSGMEVMTRAGAANLSDAEIKHLIALYSDPVLIKYMRGASDPTTMARVRQTSMTNALRIQSIVNAILAKNGLRETR